MNSKEALENLYNMACVEAGQKQQFITYAREIEHNENVKKHYDIIKQDLEQLKKENEKLKKIIKDYCYINLLPNGEAICMCCESYEESNSEDFKFIKEVLENE